MKDSDNIPTIQEDIAIAEEWAKPENLPQHIVPGEGIGWRHVCYRLAQFAKKALNPHRVVTCIYCGKECLDGPHTRGCKKHPLRNAERRNQNLQDSLTEAHLALKEAAKIIQNIDYQHKPSSNLYQSACKWLNKYL